MRYRMTRDSEPIILDAQDRAAQIQVEIGILKVKLDGLEEWLHAEPWNSEARQDFRSTQDRLNSLLAEAASL